MKCAGCDKETNQLRGWKNNKKYCSRCMEEIKAFENEKG